MRLEDILAFWSFVMGAGFIVGMIRWIGPWLKDWWERERQWEEVEG